MLVLSRRKDESIMIGDDIKITIVDIRGDKVRIGITSPKHIPVHSLFIARKFMTPFSEKKQKKKSSKGDKKTI